MGRGCSLAATKKHQEKRPLNAVSFPWRRRRDSNPRTRLPQSNDLANRPLQPLGYSSTNGDYRPIVPDFHLLSESYSKRKKHRTNDAFFLAEREGFEPSVPLACHDGFQDRYLQPLGHLSV